MAKKVYVGMSGGVDSSVTAALLQRDGYEVVGAYMKNWTRDLPGMHCPWQTDYQDAKRVATTLGIPFETFDFEEQYRERVVRYMLYEYQAGRTPNPDVMCNQEIKFKLFLDMALERGADLIATGHYARVIKGRLHKGLDANKDQSYFLYRVTGDALAQSLMPIGNLEKPAVRALARSFGLSTAEKKDSQGICFVGKVGIKDFLLHELGPQEPGDIVDISGARVGRHDGAIYYTIGQRQGLGIGGGLPYYVTGKNMDTNEVYVTTDIQSSRLWADEMQLTDVHWINEAPTGDEALQVVSRYRAAPVPVKIIMSDNRSCGLRLAEPARAITPGQSAVLFAGDECLGGGIVV